MQVAQNVPTILLKKYDKIFFFFQNGVIFFINPGPALTLDLFLTRGGERPHLFSVVFFVCVIKGSVGSLGLR